VYNCPIARLPSPLTKNAFGIFCVGVCGVLAGVLSLMVNKLAWIGKKYKGQTKEKIIGKR